jgi:hypothetical protein
MTMNTLRKIFTGSKITSPALAYCLATCGLVSSAAMAHAELIHRYSFNDDKADDSVGKVNGKLLGKAKVADGKLVLDNTGKTSDDASLSYLSFPARILPKAGSATIEVWFASKADRAYTRAFDFGERGEGYIFLTPNEGGDIARAAITSNDFGEETTLRSEGAINDGKPHMVALVVDDAGKKLHLFVDGKENGTGEALGENTLDKVQGTNRWLGRSVFETDAGFTGSIDELRIFDTALTPAEIAAHFKAGADTLETGKK